MATDLLARVRGAGGDLLTPDDAHGTDFMTDKTPRWYHRLAATALLGGIVAVGGPALAGTPLPPPADAVAAPPGAAAEAGLPFIRNFDPAEYAGATQNWSLTQDRQGVIYVGNVEDGVLTFDGTRWKHIPVPNRATVRSLALGDDGRIYVGTVGDLGYLAPDATGQLRFVSMLERIPLAQRNFADVWDTFATPEGVYFSTVSGLFRIHGNDVKVWKPRSSFHLAFRVNGTLYIREVGRGLLEMVGDQLVPVAGGERFATEKIYALLPWRGPGAKPGELLIGTRTQGWFLFDGKDYRPWATQADAVISKGGLYGAIWLADGRLAVATLQGGLYLLDAQGHLLRVLDRSSGLSTNVVFGLFQDRQRGLWIAAGNGISRVDIDSPITHFGERSGMKGAVIALQRYHGTLYVGTTEGLYRMVGGAESSARLEQIPQVPGQNWAFVDVGTDLLVANTNGVYSIGRGEPRAVLASQETAFSLLRSRQNPARVFVGTQNGVGSLRLDGDRWIDEGRIAAVRGEPHSMAQTDDGRLWLGSWGGVMRLMLPADWRGAKVDGDRVKVDTYGTSEGLPDGQGQVVEIDGKPRFLSMDGIYQFDDASARFLRDPRFARLFPDGLRQIIALHQDATGRLWMDTADRSRGVEESGSAVADAHGVWRWSTTPLQPIAGSGVMAIGSDPDGVVWLGGYKGLFRYDPARGIPNDAHFGALLRGVAGQDGRMLFAGARAGSAPAIPYQQNALRFEFAAPSFDKADANRFQVWLQGLDRDWSPWSGDAYRDYTNIPEGTYRFRVRARNVYGKEGKEAVFDFRVLPPWYRTGWAWTIWIASAVLALGLLMRWRSATLRRRNRVLAALVGQRTRELEEANRALAEQTITDPLTGLKNRRYLHDHIEQDIALARRHYLAPPLSDPNAPDPAALRAALLDRNVNLLFLMVDIDHFKEVNDTYGHAAGDLVLQQFRDVLQAATRETDTPVRWGGEEFLVVARFTNRESGPRFAERIRAMVAAHAFQLGDGRSIHRTCSVGFASYPFFPGEPDRLNWEQVVNLADECLYAAKHGGRNAWVGVEAGSEIPAGSITDALQQSLQRAPAPGPLRILGSRCAELA